MTATATASKLDTDKFAKVHRLMTEGATEGERNAGRLGWWLDSRMPPTTPRAAFAL